MWPWKKSRDSGPFISFDPKSVTPPPAPATGGVVKPDFTRSYNATITSSMSYDQMYKLLMGGARPGVVSAAASADVKFSGKEFAVSTAKGARSFRIDDLGRLTGIHFKQVWTPGENTAFCRAETEHAEGKFPECKCGFYGYYDGSNDYYSPGYVSAVVEGYGEAVLGSQGFRVGKAKIIALSIDSNVQAKNAHLVRRNYPDVPLFDSFSQMLAEYPTDYGVGTPSTDEPDFWTRSA